MIRPGCRYRRLQPGSAGIVLETPESAERRTPELNNGVHFGFVANGERRKSAVALRDRDEFRAGRKGRYRRAPGCISRWKNNSTALGGCLSADVGECSITQVNRDQPGFFLRGSRSDEAGDQ